MSRGASDLFLLDPSVEILNVYHNPGSLAKVGQIASPDHVSDRPSRKGQIITSGLDGAEATRETRTVGACSVIVCPSIFPFFLGHFGRRCARFVPAIGLPVPQCASTEIARPRLCWGQETGILGLKTKKLKVLLPFRPSSAR